MQRTGFGLRPYDRRKLEWSIATAEDSKARETLRVVE